MSRSRRRAPASSRSRLAVAAPQRRRTARATRRTVAASFSEATRSLTPELAAALDAADDSALSIDDVLDR